MFIGDSRIRALYFSFLSLMSKNSSTPEYKAHSDLSFTDEEIGLKLVSVLR